MAIFDVLKRIPRLFALISMVIGAFYYVSETDERLLQAENQQKAKHYQAWQVINSAIGKRSNSGRIDALQDLSRDGISLAGVDISKANLPKMNLAGADLYNANFEGASLVDANFVGANLVDANFVGANLYGADFTGAKLSRANLSNAKLWDANFTKASLFYANFTGTGLRDANLTSANLFSANLAGAYLAGANLTDADLTEANLGSANLTNIESWQKIKNIEYANIYDVNNPPEGFVDLVTEYGAVSIKDNEEWKKFIHEKEQEKPKKK